MKIGRCAFASRRHGEATQEASTENSPGGKYLSRPRSLADQFRRMP